MPSDTVAPTGTTATELTRVEETNRLNPRIQTEMLPSSRSHGEEQALESHEVIELQTFSERKTWIEEKIKFLDKMPPIEVFAGLDAVQSSAEEVPGLPTRAELQQWLAEHDTIEKETEVFDTGELKKLRQLTKAATQRNLSPQDTDVIELTLTTIYELDKLLHLLRDRSEHLELLSVRLTWEENRIGSWKDRRGIINDLNVFLTKRARWSPSIYDGPSPMAEDVTMPSRRASVTSLASVGSDTSVSVPSFSRSARFKLAELLSRDAAQFGARITSLRHGKVATAGKALDKLIDNSRKPVPEVLLDEQDHLEEKCINEMEHVGKFVMNLVMQWRKADEIYVETKKDQLSAQNLLEEIETAKLQLPTSRQSSLFASRADTILKRLSVRCDPASATSTFPLPEHPLFLDQKAFNVTLAENLSLEIATATTMARAVDVAAKQYRNKYDAVKRVETMVQSANELSESFATVIQRFKDGVTGSDEDGTPPDLTTEACLEPTRHSVFVALLPSMLEEMSRICEPSDELLRTSHIHLGSLDLLDIDAIYRDSAAADIRRLRTMRQEAQSLCDSVSEKVVKLREARRIWSLMDDKVKELDGIRLRIFEVMEKQRWRQESNGTGAPLTPESPTILLSSVGSTHADINVELHRLHHDISSTVEIPLQTLATDLRPPLKDYLLESSKALKRRVENVQQMLQLLTAIQKQSAAMNLVREEHNDFLLRIENLKIQFRQTIDDTLGDHTVIGPSNNDTTDMFTEMKSVQDKVTTFLDSLSKRIPFVSGRPSPGSPTFSKRHFSTPSLKLAGNQPPDMIIDLPFDLGVLDASVRADSNSYAMRLSGRLEMLKESHMHLEVAQMAKELDSTLSATLDGVDNVIEDLNGHKLALADFVARDEGVLTSLDKLSSVVEDSSLSNRRRISLSFASIRELLRRIDTSSAPLERTHRDQIYVARMRNVENAEECFRTWEEHVARLKDDISQARAAELHRQEAVRNLEEKTKREEQERLAAEERENIRLAEERLAMEEKQRLEAERQAQERMQEAEHQRLLALETERIRFEAEQKEARERQRLEEEAAVEAARLKADEERIVREEAEKARLQREREEMEEKLRLVQEELEEQRRWHAERERLDAEKAEREKQDLEEKEQRQREKEEKERERLEAEEAELERLREKEEKERERLEAEKAELERRELEEKEEKERERLEAEKAELERRELEEEEQKRRERKVQEKERLDSEKAERERRELEEEGRKQQEKEAREREQQLANEAEEKRLIQEAEERQLAQELREEKEKREGQLAKEAEEQPLAHEAGDRQLAQDGEQKGMTHEAEEGRWAKDAKEQVPRGVEVKQQKAFLETEGNIATHKTPRLSKQADQKAGGVKALMQLYSESDVFGLNLAPLNSPGTQNKEVLNTQALIFALRKRLHSLNINEVLRPTKPSAYLPTRAQITQMTEDFLHISSDVDKLPPSVDTPAINTELRSLRMEVEAFSRLLTNTEPLIQMSEAVRLCDAGLSDLLEHIDSYPALPPDVMSSSFEASKNASPEEQLSARLAFVRGLIQDMKLKFSAVSNDARAISEHRRVDQTWLELEDMGNDRLGGKKSRPVSVVSSRHSSGRSSSVSMNTSSAKKVGSYSHLSASSGPSRGRLNVPPRVTSRRVVSGEQPRTRPSSRLSVASTSRSVSGSSLFGSTFASRQRTTSLSNSTSTAAQPPAVTPSRSRAHTGQNKRTGSPSMSERSTSRSAMASRTSTTSTSTWSRAPRNSLSSMVARVTTPQKKTSTSPRKKYIADPKSKLDVAVGDVVNQLPVGINIEGVSETWKDQSGKYWIGNQDPKLCFCRILRSQTVMVRVGGGWTELSRFIQDHCADSFRLLPESPPRYGMPEEKWISSATLLEAPEFKSPPLPPRTPEPKVPFVPSFSLLTPSGQSPQSIRSSPSAKGSPLTPLQFMRRAEPDPSLLRPVTPSKPPQRTKNTNNTHTPARNSVWRP